MAAYLHFEFFRRIIFTTCLNVRGNETKYCLLQRRAAHRDVDSVLRHMTKCKERCNGVREVTKNDFNYEMREKTRTKI